MTYDLSEQEKQGVMSAPDERQYDYFLNKTSDWGAVWALHDGGWERYEPKPIKIHDFLALCGDLTAAGEGLAINAVADDLRSYLELIE